MKKNILIMVFLIIVVALAAFFGGIKYQESKTPQFLRERDGGPRTRPMGQREGVNMLRGEIISREEGSITIKQADSSSKIVLVSESTEINKASEGSFDDLKENEEVVVLGKENSDKSITAESIQLNPGMGARFRPGEE